jgi:putative membrane protein
VRYLLNILRGFLMGSADVVPGVSGGTVALILGIYERLVASIHAGSAALGLGLRGRWADARRRLGDVEWPLLLPLLAGIGIAVLSLASLIDRLLEEQPQNTAAAFFGLVLGSIVIAWRLVRRWDSVRIGTGTAVAIVAFVVLGLRGEPVVEPSLVLFVGAGMIAIVAMILPGISGSFILLMLGMYQVVLDAVNDRDLAVVGVFLVGAVVGLALFSTVLNHLLRTHHDTVMAALIGLMLGSLRVLWPWPDGADTAALSAPVDPLMPSLLALAGLAVVLVIGWMARERPATSHQPPASSLQQDD